MASTYQVALAICTVVACCQLHAIEADVTAGETSKAVGAGSVPPPQVVKLQRESVLLPKTGRRKNFYSAKVEVGAPKQEFRMNFDLGGGTFVLPSITCHDAACLERRRYDREVSSTAFDIQANGEVITGAGSRGRLDRLRRGRDKGKLGFHSVDLGSGSIAGNFVRDTVCLASEAPTTSEERCFPMAMLVAQSMSDLPCALEPYDGTIGLGLQGMSLTTEFNFLAALHSWHPDTWRYKGNIPNAFGLHLGTNDADGGEITFGGYDLSRLSSPLEWVSVVDPEDGFWQVEISAVRVGNHTMEACGKGASCRAVIDYGASLLSVPQDMAGGFEKTLSGLAAPSGFGDGCQHLALPDLQLVLPGDITLTLPSEDFVSGFAPVAPASPGLAPASCSPKVSQHDVIPETKTKQSVFVLGEATLRRYYTFFNADELKVGFSLASSSPTGAAGKRLPLLASGKKDGKQSKVPSSQSGVILLVQLKIKRTKTMPTPAL